MALTLTFVMRSRIHIRNIRMFRVVIGVAVASLVFASPGRGQFLTNASPKSAADTSATKTVSPGSPRASVQEFLRLTTARDWVGAAEYIATSPGARDSAPVLARRLRIVLDQRLSLDVRKLSPLAVGDTTDGDVTGDRIGTIASPSGREDPVRVVRDERLPGRWVFSAPTVNAVDTWYENLGSPWVRDRVPPTLMGEGPWHVFYWQWIALAIAIPILVILAWLVGGLLRGILTRLAARTATEWDDLLVLHLRGPFRLWVAAVAASPLLNVIELNTRVQAFVDSTTRGLVLIALFWGVLRVIRLVQERVVSVVWDTGDNQQARTLVPLLGNILRVTLGFVAILVALSQFGYPVGTLLAGLGIGGIAVALAGQKTVEHLFGSVSLAADRAFRVGDFVRAGSTEGTIERIGLRSTSFRTNERTVVRIPNGRLADERIETFGERDRMFLRTDLDLAFGTTAKAIDATRDAIEARIREHPKVWPDAVRVHVVSFTESAIRMRIFAWFETRDWSEFLDIRHRLLLDFIDIVEVNGSSIAYPSRTVYHVTDEGSPPVSPTSPQSMSSD